MGKRTNIDGVQPPKNNEQYPQNTRWLYDDEADYKRAQKKMAAEAAREERDKQLARKARVGQIKGLGAKLASLVKIAANLTRTALGKAFSPKHRKKTFMAASGLVATLVLVYVFAAKNQDTQVLGEDLPQSPQYDVLAPNNNAKDTSGGQVDYDAQRQLARYTDAIGSTNAIISQQPLPEAFNQNPAGELASLAQQINASEQLNTGSALAYMSPYEKGMQRVVLIKQQVLVFITANQELDKAALLDYIDSLR